GAAARLGRHLALAGRIDGAVGDVRALAELAGAARLARAGAGLVAADALGAERALALLLIRARRPVLLEPARVVDAGVGRNALAVVGAGEEAAGRVADERAARDQIGRDALAGGVAGRGRLVDVAGRVAGLLGAQRADGPALAGAVAVALAVGAAGRLRGRHADAARIGRAGRDRRAAAERRRQRAAPAAAAASLIAADAVDAVAVLAFARLLAALPVLLRPAGFVHAGDTGVTVCAARARRGASAVCAE